MTSDVGADRLAKHSRRPLVDLVKERTHPPKDSECRLQRNPQSTDPFKALCLQVVFSGSRKPEGFGGHPVRVIEPTSSQTHQSQGMHSHMDRSHSLFEEEWGVGVGSK